MSMLEVSQNPHLDCLLYTFFQISCFCSHGFSSHNAQSIAPAPLCLPPLHPTAQLLSIAASVEAVKPSALSNTIKSDFLASSLPIAASSPSSSRWNHCQLMAKTWAPSSTSCSANVQTICTSPSLSCFAHPSTYDCSFLLVPAAAKL